MTSLRFIGDLALWQGLLLALAVAALSWWLYWRETRALNGVARLLLPTLRSSAIVLALLVLTAPVLHHRYREGEPGRLRFLIDSSRSMSVVDRQFDNELKLEIARSLAWTAGQNIEKGPEKSSDTSADKSTEKSADQFANKDDSKPPSQDQTPTSRANGSTSFAGSAEAIERFDKTPRYERALDRLLTADGGLLAQVHEDFEIIVQRFDQQRSTLWESSLSQSAPLPNNPRDWLPETFPAATALGSALAGGGARSAQSSDAAGAPRSAEPNSLGSAASPAPTAIASQPSDETLVLLSDGRNTSGVSPLTMAESLAAQRRPVFIIGYGGSQNPEDISLVAVEHPERVFERDMLRGTVVVRQRMKTAAPMKVMVKLGDEVVWEETRTLSDSDRGRVDFAIAVKPLVENIQRSASRNTDFSSVPLHLEASVEPQSGEVDSANNARAFHVSVVTKRSRLLLVDGRSRWETRYLHNMFERDPAWQVDIVLPDAREKPATLPQGTAVNQWPSTKERLLEYDLIILGDLPSTTLPRESIDWMKSFVESSGGGLIVIDGARGALRDPAYKTLQQMLPIEWIEDKRVKPDPVPVQLTPAAKQLSAFQLTPLDPAKNDATWSELPALHLTTAVKALPGSEVLATTLHAGVEVPLFATRQFGAGRVFYCGTDETWRWRYKVADIYHQRFWNQVARWVMRLPMSVQGQFVSIDSGKLVYQPGETVVIRSRLRDAQGDPAVGLAVEAVVTALPPSGSAPSASESPIAENPVAENPSAGAESQQPTDSKVMAVVPLEADSAIAGVYSGQIVAPAGGNYHVTIVAPGLTSSALAVHSEFSVVEPETGEMDQLSCDEALLMKVAQMTGGQYLSEERGDELADLLRPLSRGKIVESDTPVWQSYWWFVPIVLLLSIEWWLRKRVGLI